MDPSEVIVHLAQKEGKKLRYRPDDHDPVVPFIRVTGKRLGHIQPFNHIGHDNEARMDFVRHLFTNIIGPSFHTHTPALQGDFNIELHDSYSYLPRGCEEALYTGCMTWSKNRTHNHVVLLPDLYQLSNYGNGSLITPDSFSSWSQKPLDKIGFFGTTTGNRSPLLNQRIQTCVWARDHKDIVDAYITKVAQMSEQDVVQSIGVSAFKDILHDRVSHQDMFKYKFLLDIPGNTASWDRVPLVLQSKSLLFKMPCSDMTWYYPLLHNNTHYVAVGHNSIESNLKYYLANPKEANFIIDCANKFANTFLTGRHALLYTTALMEEAAHNLAA